MPKININGKTYQAGSSIVINDKIIIDGKDVTPDDKEIKIVIQGDFEKLDVAMCETVYVEGNVGEVKTQAGDIKIKGNIEGNAKTMAGDITCLNIGGQAKTMAGDIKHNKKAKSTGGFGTFT